jgi:hypothetical protein
MFVDEMKSDGFHNLNEQQQMVLLSLIELYKQQVEFKQEQMMRQQMAMQGGGPPGGGPPGGEEGG